MIGRMPLSPARYSAAIGEVATARHSRNQKLRCFCPRRTCSIRRQHTVNGSRNAVLKFIASHQHQISGVLSGFDRVVFRGTLRSMAYAAGMQQYLSSNDVLLKHFGAHVEQVSRRLKAASLAEAVATGRPVRYLASA